MAENPSKSGKLLKLNANPSFLGDFGLIKVVLDQEEKEEAEDNTFPKGPSNLKMWEYQLVSDASMTTRMKCAMTMATYKKTICSSLM